MKRIELEYPGNENKQKKALFKAWLEGHQRSTWTSLLEALGRVSSSLRDEVTATYLEGHPPKLVS